jgi:hypothetical protein
MTLFWSRALPDDRDRVVLLGILTLSLLATGVPSTAAAPHHDAHAGQFGIVNRCWEQRTEFLGRPRPTSTVTYCFKWDGSVDGFYFEGGHGGDLTAKWRLDNAHKLILEWSTFLEGDAEDYCSFAFNDDGNVLMLSDCDHKGVWSYDERMTHVVFGEKRDRSPEAQ